MNKHDRAAERVARWLAMRDGQEWTALRTIQQAHYLIEASQIVILADTAMPNTYAQNP